MVLRGALQHKDLWLIDLETGAEHQLTDLAPDFTVRDFDVSPDGSEIVLEQVQQHSDIVLLDISASAAAGVVAPLTSTSQDKIVRV